MPIPCRRLDRIRILRPGVRAEIIHPGVIEPRTIPAPKEHHLIPSDVRRLMVASRRRVGGGGLDDRFDFIFGSYGIADDQGIDYVDNTYWAFGNDTHHFNDDINDGTNTAVSEEVADALYYASDHLPVIADFVSIAPLNSETPSSPYVLRLDQNHPNPFVTFTTIPYEISSSGLVTVEVYDVSGRLITRILEGVQIEGSHVVGWNGRDVTGKRVGGGIYFYTVESRESKQSKPMPLLR